MAVLARASARYDVGWLFTRWRQPHRLLDIVDVAKPGSLIRSRVRKRFRTERRNHFQIVFRNKRADRQLPFHHHRERRRLHPPYRQFIAESQRVGARKVHADKPVGTASAPSGIGQGLVITGWFHRVEAAPNGFRSQR